MSPPNALVRYAPIDCALRRVKSARGLGFWSLASLLGIVALVGLENLASEKHAYAVFFIYAPQQGWGLLPLSLLLLSLRRRSWRLLACNALALFLWAKFLLGFAVPWVTLFRFRAEKPSLRLMTYNVQRGELGFDKLVQTIEAQNPDILCLQESQHPAPETFLFPGDEFKRTYKTWNIATAGDVMTLSRFPLLSQRVFPLYGTRKILETIWKTPTGNLRVLNIHITTSEAEKRSFQDNWLEFSVKIVAHLQPMGQIRRIQVPPIHDAIAANQTMPLVVAGDFNSPARGEFYRALTSQTTDAWKEGGFGTAPTFPSSLSLLDIDHIFLRGANARRVWVPTSRASDHRPLVADLFLAP